MIATARMLTVEISRDSRSRVLPSRSSTNSIISNSCEEKKDNAGQVIYELMQYLVCDEKYRLRYGINAVWGLVLVNSDG